MTCFSKITRASVLLGGLLLASLNHSAFAWDVTPTDVSFSNADGHAVPGKLFSPATPPDAALPAVIMLHGCAGIYNANGTVSSIYREWGDRLVAAGYVALLVDSYTPRGAANQCGNGAGVGVSEIFDRPKDASAAYAHLSTLPYINASKVGVLGWSNGGSTVVATLATTNPVDTTIVNPYASSTPLKVGIAFYAGCGLADNQCGTQKNGKPASCWGGLSGSKWASYAPLQMLHGTADSTVSIQSCTTRTTLAQSQPGGASVALAAFNNAQHSYDDPSVGIGTCVDSSSTPNSCAKQQSDVAAMNILAGYLK